MLRNLLLSAGVVCLIVACANRAIRSTATAQVTAAQMAELWYAPETARDLFLGVGGTRLAPDPAVTYKVLEIKRSGFSMGMTVEGPGTRKWSVKFPPEASTEVVASRLLWGVGYHQPPIFYVGKWNTEGASDPNPQLPGRTGVLDALRGDPKVFEETPFIKGMAGQYVRSIIAAGTACSWTA